MKLSWLTVLVLIGIGCGDSKDNPFEAPNPDAPAATGDGDATTGDGDTATGDGDTATGDGDPATGDGDPATGDGDPASGDGDTTTGDGDVVMPTAKYTRIAGGTFGPLAGYEASTASGAALIAVGPDGTEVSLQISGLSPSTTYPTHVHALPCALLGGSHYKLDPSVMDTAEANELWPVIETDADGQATVTLANAHAARGDAMAIVIHDPAADNAKMLCADLETTDFDLSSAMGTFAPFADAADGDMGIAGTASLTRSAAGTTVTLEVEGLSESEEYAVHVHTLPCATTNAGGHYKLDTAVEETLADNELWPALTVATGGTGTASLMSTHVARPDAQSVVIHRKTADAAPKVACADLMIAPATLVQSGDLLPLAGAGDKGLTLAGDAELKRKTDGTASVEIAVIGLSADTEYPTHLHDHPCDVGDGGGHYKLDRSVADTMEANEVWLTFTSDAAGAGTREVELAALPRADAQSIVVHDGTDGTRLACVPLQ